MAALAAPARAAPFELVATHPDAAAQPAETQGHVLNTLKPFNGRLYAGFGAYAANTGPIGVRAFDPAAGAFGPRLLDSRTEAILIYREINGRLYAPNIDPWPSPPTPAQRTGYALGTAGGAGGSDTWADVLPIASGHMFDIATRDGSDLWLAGSDCPDCRTPPGGNQNAQVWRSPDGGATWGLSLQVAPQRPNATFARFHAIHAFNGKLYAQAHDFSVDGASLGPQSVSKVFDGAGWSDGPSLSGGLIGFLWHPETFADHMVYQRNHAGIQTGRLFKFDGTQAAPIAFPGSTQTIRDYTVSEGVLYGLLTDGRIYRTSDLREWTFLDTAPADGRSLGVLDNTLYVGATGGRLFRYSVPVPDPGTATLLGFACLALRRSRRG